MRAIGELLLSERERERLKKDLLSRFHERMNERNQMKVVRGGAREPGLQWPPRSAPVTGLTKRASLHDVAVLCRASLVLR